MEIYSLRNMSKCGTVECKVECEISTFSVSSDEKCLMIGLENGNLYSIYYVYDIFRDTNGVWIVFLFRINSQRNFK